MTEESTMLTVPPTAEEKLSSNQLHGEIVADESGFMAKLGKKNIELNKKTVDSYYSVWDDDKKNIKNNEGNVQKRRAHAQRMTNAFYDLVTDFYEYGWGQSFHFAKMYKGDTFEENIKRHESYLALKLGLKRGDKVLDVGCGVGGPLREVVKASGGAHVTGINNNVYQIERCQAYSRKYSLEPFTDFVKGDFLKMPIADNTFDGAYSCESTVHAPRLEMVYAEIFRILKPGGKFACYEWGTTTSYDENDVTQKKIVLAIEEGNSISKLYTTPEILAAVKSVGFNVIEYEDIATAEVDATLPWYTALSHATGLRGFARSPLGRGVTHTFLTLFQALRLVPKGSRETSRLLNDAADALVKGGERGIFTPMFFFLAQKPLDAPQ